MRPALAILSKLSRANGAADLDLSSLVPWTECKYAEAKPHVSILAINIHQSGL